MSIAAKLSKMDNILVRFIFPLGLFIQLTGILWIGSRGSWVSQTYTWLILPGFLSCLCQIPRIRQWRPEWVEILLVAFLLWAFCSLAWSDTSLSWTDIFKRCFFILLYVYVLVRLSGQPDKLKKIMILSFILATIAALCSVGYHYIILGQGIGVREYRISRLFHGLADLGYPVQAGLYYGIFVTLLFSWFSCSDKKMNVSVLAGVFLATLILGFYILETWSRGAWIATLAGILIVALLKKDKCIFIVLSLIVIACLVFILLNYSEFHTQIADETLSGRTDIWKTAISRIMSHPWAGSGIDSGFIAKNNSGDVVHHPHSYYLQLLRMYGVIGGVLFVGLLVGLLHLIFRYRHEPMVVMAAGILVVGLIGMLTDVSHIISRPGDSWLYLWLPAGLLIGVRYHNKLKGKRSTADRY